MAKMPNSTETILTFKKNDDLENLSDWSIMWSTSTVPGMDMATGAGSTRRRKYGRRRLRLAALTLGCFLTMHTRVVAAALTGGYFIFVMLLVLLVAIMANPMRHFEVYLGQWSLSGPGRAFRIIPMLDGIGIAICIHAILRAVLCVVIAGMMGVYLSHTTSDDPLPYTYCRNMDLKSYQPETRYIKKLHSFSLSDLVANPRRMRERRDLGSDEYWKRTTTPDQFSSIQYNENGTTSLPHVQHVQLESRQIKRTSLYCNETYRNNFPPIFVTPSYNFFYVELAHYRTDHKILKLNKKLLIAVAIVWVVLWAFLIFEKVSHGRMIWNNMYPWIICIPWVWAGVLIFTGLQKFFSREKPFRNIFHIAGHKEVLDFVSDVFVVASYIHAAALGSELIHGKGLNYYASGHVDHKLNSDNVWHSCILVSMAAICAGGASVCALTDYMQMKGVNKIQESTLWVIPMLSKCAVGGHYAHFLSTIIFFGLMVSYMIVAFVCLKTALHTIFEYKVKLVFVEQFVVAILILLCMSISAGVGLLEGVDLFLAGVATPMISALEMVALLWVYRSRDFMSDMLVATEENACSSRIGIQWQILPIFQVILMVIEALTVTYSELPGIFNAVGFLCVLIIILALPLRACHNAYNFLQPPNPH